MANFDTPNLILDNPHENPIEFRVYKKFYEQAQAKELTDILTANGFEFEVVDDTETLDSLYGDKQFKNQFLVKVRSDDFERVDALLAKASERDVQNVSKDHYLFGFTDEELFEVVSKPDEWNAFDCLLAKKILKDRGKEVSDAAIELIKNQRNKDLAKPEEGQKAWIFVGYLFALLGGIIGVFIGWHLSTHKKTLPNGQLVYGYKKADRMHGRAIWIIGSIMFIISLWIKFSVADE